MLYPRATIIAVGLLILLASCSKPAPQTDLVATKTAIANDIFATLTAEVSQESQLMNSPATQSATSSSATNVSDVVAPTAVQEARETATSVPAAVVLLPSATPTPPPEPTTTPTSVGPGAAVRSAGLNIRGGPSTDFSIVSTVVEGDWLSITGRNNDSTWYEIQTPDRVSGWVLAELVEANGAAESVNLAAVIPTLPPTPIPADTATPAPPAQVYGLHDRQTIGRWEIQPERLHNEKTVWHYGDGTTAMGTYAIVIILAKNLAPGTTSPNDTLWFDLVDERGRIFEYSGPLTTERTAMSAAAWQFVVHPTIFRDVDPGVETPMLLLWDVPQDVESLSLVIGNNISTVSWDLGNFSNIPPFEKDE